ncbi:MAG: peptidase [Knoellia sp.]
MTLGPRRRRRRMLRRLELLDRLDVQSSPPVWRGPHTPAYAAPQPQRRSRVAVVPIVATLAITAGLLWVRGVADEQIDHVASIVPMSQVRPPLAADAQLGRLVAAPQAPAGSRGFELLSTNPVSTAAYDPCRPLHLVVNREHAPSDADAVLRDAISMVGPAAGLQIVVDGPTDELAQSTRPTMDSGRYGNRWSPALVAWTTPERVPALDGDVAGVGGSVAMTDSRGHLHNVTGIVYLDGPTLTEISRQKGGHELAVAIVAHELTHLLGLAHTEAAGQLMNAEHSGQTGLGEGDRRGLAALAAVPCNRQF